MSKPPPEWTEHRSDTQRTADDIATACRSIRRDWPHMHRPGDTQAPGRANPAGVILPDHDRRDSDTRRVDKTISLRRFVQDCLNATSRVVMEDRPVTNAKALPLGTDVPQMCEFIARHADWISGQDTADDIRDELTDLSKRVHLVAFPTRRESMSIGRCPIEIPGEQDVLEVCGGDVRYRLQAGERDGEAMAACSRCGEAAVTSWWAERMFLDGEASPLVTIGELVAVIAYRLGIVVTHEQIRQWRTRGKIEPECVDQKGRTLYRHEAVIDAMRADIRKRAARAER